MYSYKEITDIPINIIKNLKCRICNNFCTDVVLNNINGGLYCKRCIKNDLSADVVEKIPMLIKDLLNNLMVYCDQCDKDKVFAMKRIDFIDHDENHCKSVPCKNKDCKELLIKSNIYQHQCPFEPVKCSSNVCNWVGIASNYQQHISNCSFVKLADVISNLFLDLSLKKSDVCKLKEQIIKNEEQLHSELQKVCQLEIKEKELNEKLNLKIIERKSKEYQTCVGCESIQNIYSTCNQVPPHLLFCKPFWPVQVISNHSKQCTVQKFTNSNLSDITIKKRIDGFILNEKINYK